MFDLRFLFSMNGNLIFSHLIRLNVWFPPLAHCNFCSIDHETKEREEINELNHLCTCWSFFWDQVFRVVFIVYVKCS